MGEKESAREVALSGPDTAEAARLNALPPGVPVTGTLATAPDDPGAAGEGSPEMKKGTVKFFNEQ